MDPFNYFHQNLGGIDGRIHGTPVCGGGGHPIKLHQTMAQQSPLCPAGLRVPRLGWRGPVNAWAPLPPLRERRRNRPHAAADRLDGGRGQWAAGWIETHLEMWGGEGTFARAQTDLPAFFLEKLTTHDRGGSNTPRKKIIIAPKNPAQPSAEIKPDPWHPRGGPEAQTHSPTFEDPPAPLPPPPITQV